MSGAVSLDAPWPTAIFPPIAHRSLNPMPRQVLIGERVFELDLPSIDGREAEVALEHVADGTYHLLLDGRSFTFTAERQADGVFRLSYRGRTLEARVRTERDLLLERFGLEEGAEAGAEELRAPMPGLVVAVLVEPGQEVEAGAGLVVLEAMKMENELKAAAAGTVADVHVAPGSAVSKGDLLVSFQD